MVPTPDIPEEQRMQVLHVLLESCKNGKPRHGIFTEISAKTGISTRTLTRIWNAAKTQIKEGTPINVLSVRKMRIREKKHHIDYPRIEAIDVNKRRTIEALSGALGISKATVGRWAKGHLLRPHTSALKPLLTAPNILRRLNFSLQSLNFDIPNNLLRFKPMENTVHIDEKWFYITTKTSRYYLTPTESDPLRVTQSKNFIPKVMFLCAVSRPVLDENGVIIFYGKLGIWPFVEEHTAQRDSIHRKKGTKELKPTQSITRAVIKGIIIQKVLPAIKAKWPSCLSKQIMIQQDNARPHMHNDDPDFQDMANADGFQMQFIQQPANSPDCNALDLGFFCAIQALQQREKCRTSDDLIKAVTNSFDALDPMTLNKVFLSLQCVLKEIIRVKGTNDYKHVHMNKNALLREGVLPKDLTISEYLVREGIDHLIKEECTDGIEDLMQVLGINPPQNGGGLIDLNF